MRALRAEVSGLAQVGHQVDRHGEDPGAEGVGEQGVPQRDLPDPGVGGFGLIRTSRPTDSQFDICQKLVVTVMWADIAW